MDCEVGLRRQTYSKGLFLVCGHVLKTFYMQRLATILKCKLFAYAQLRESKLLVLWYQKVMLKLSIKHLLQIQRLPMRVFETSTCKHCKSIRITCGKLTVRIHLFCIYEVVLKSNTNFVLVFVNFVKLTAK